MRISDWSSDVCSSDLQHHQANDAEGHECAGAVGLRIALDLVHHQEVGAVGVAPGEIGIGFEEKGVADLERSEEHTSELQSLMRISYAVFCLKKNTQHQPRH